MHLTTRFAPRWKQEDSSKRRSKNRLIPVVLAAAMLLAVAMSVPAETITPIAVKYSNAYSAVRVPVNLFNATGMNVAETILYNLDGSIGGEPTTVDGVSWVTSSAGSVPTEAAAGRIWIVIDLGASYNLEKLDIWNFQWNHSTAGDLSNRGVSQFDVFVRNTEADTDDGTAGGTPINVSNSGYNDFLSDDAVFNLGTSSQWQLALSNQTLAQAPNNDTYTATAFDLSGNTARFIAIRVDSYYGGSGVGLGKIRVHGVLGGVSVSLSSALIASNAVPGTLVGTLDMIGTNGTGFAYALDSGGDTTHFEIVGSTHLRTKAWMDADAYNISVVGSKDAYSVTTDIPISVTSVADDYLASIVSAEVSAAATGGETVGILQARASDASAITFTLTSGRTDLFEITGTTNLTVATGANVGAAGATHYLGVQIANDVATNNMVVAVGVVSGTARGSLFLFR